MIAPVSVQGDEILEQVCGVPPSAHWLQMSNMVFLAWHRLDPAGWRVDRCWIGMVAGMSDSVHGRGRSWDSLKGS